ncbi:hypothetical protein LSTR_LSTR016680 [Laodelphax striatellus]|uniref:Uncharacterized protein n=1 Tax=Laodelphax striatellus TaxID=195883 RepID=A0A482WVA3_LAOST|nr:hypothetical protein LSTR_LSTR016680 [Laodelphax striatellus]
MCPCYFVTPGNGTNPPADHSQGSLPPGYVIGYIPVVFYPYCSGNGEDQQQAIRPFFPSAFAVPYQCNQCNSRALSKRLTNSEAQQQNYFKDALRNSHLYDDRVNVQYQKSATTKRGIFGDRIIPRRRSVTPVE